MASYYLPPVDRIGAGYMQHYLANAYVRAGHSVTMFSPVTEKADDALYDLKPVSVGKRNRFFAFAWQLRSQNLGRFDLLHTGSEAFFLFGIRRPYHITTYHGSCLAEALHAKALKDRFRMLILALAETVQCLLSDRSVCVSRSTRRYIPMAREVIWNGVDRALFCPGRQKSEAPTIFFVGELNSRKRGSELVRIFESEIRPVLPNAELWIARDSAAVDVPGVKVFGRVSTEKLVELYQRAWVFCLPSSYEGFGVPYIEAMSCGAAVVATPNEGAREVLGEGMYGKIADLPDLGRALLEILRDGGERQRMVELGLMRAEAFDWDCIVKSYLSKWRKR